MSNLLEFSSDRVNIFSLNIDESGSMSSYDDLMRKAVREYKESFRDFSEVNSIAVAMNRFNENFHQDTFKKIMDIDFKYNPGGGTALYYTIEKSAKELQEYVNEIIMNTGVYPRATFIVFSDGRPEGDPGTREGAMKALAELNAAGIDTVFCAFGSSVKSKFGEKLGFVATIDIESGENLITFFKRDLSESCKEQSRSLKSLGNNFFSKANQSSSSKEYSNKATEVINDKEWFNDIFSDV